MSKELINEVKKEIEVEKINEKKRNIRTMLMHIDKKEQAIVELEEKVKNAKAEVILLKKQLESDDFKVCEELKRIESNFLSNTIYINADATYTGNLNGSILL